MNVPAEWGEFSPVSWNSSHNCVAGNRVFDKHKGTGMKLVQTVLQEIAQAEGTITADEVVSQVIEKMYASGATPQACDDIRERLIGIAICAMGLLCSDDRVNERTEFIADNNLQAAAARVLH
ncbi:MAG: hypothetical protein HRT77_04320 [Halioglobus sp.]|nr:hypothetical protein [Halioglobus sp.]